MPNTNPFPHLKVNLRPMGAVLIGAEGWPLLTVYGADGYAKARATYVAQAINEREGLLDLLAEARDTVPSIEDERPVNRALLARIDAALAKRTP